MLGFLKKNTSAALGCIFAVCLLYYLHPYYGIRHDSPLYLGQAMLAMDPATFKNDMFFAYGSQADYTIMPVLLGWFCSIWHPAKVFLALSAFSLVLFAFSSYILARKILGAKFGYWGLLSLLIFPAVYAGNWILSYAESFLTGRSLSEPIVLLVIAAYLSRRYAWAILLFILAATLHPLQALGGLLVIWIHLVQQKKAWLHLLWVPVLLFLASLAGTPHLEFLSARFDPQWFEWLMGPNRLTFLSEWTSVDWIFILTDAFLILLWTRSRWEPASTLARSILIATFLGFALSYVFYEQLRFVLLGGLQLWRVDWLLHWFAMVSIPALLYIQYQKTQIKSIEFWALFTIVALGTQNRISPEMGKIVFVLIPLYLAWPRIKDQISPRLVAFLLYSMPLAFAVALLKFIQQSYERYHASWHFGTPLTMHYMLLSNPVIGGLCVIALVYLFLRRPKWQVYGVFLALAALIFSVTTWDRRSDWTLEIEQTRGDGSEFSIKMEPQAQVFWSNDLLGPWLVLRRASYFSAQQTAGILFNRETAREVMKRHAELNALNGSLDSCKAQKINETGDEACNIQGVTLTALCRVAKPYLDYIVLDFQSDERYAGVWNLKAKDIMGKPISYYLYRCSDLIAGADSKSSGVVHGTQSR